MKNGTRVLFFLIILTFISTTSFGKRPFRDDVVANKKGTWVKGQYVYVKYNECLREIDKNMKVEQEKTLQCVVDSKDAGGNLTKDDFVTCVAKETNWIEKKLDPADIDKCMVSSKIAGGKLDPVKMTSCLQALPAANLELNFENELVSCGDELVGTLSAHLDRMGEYYNIGRWVTIGTIIVAGVGTTTAPVTFSEEEDVEKFTTIFGAIVTAAGTIEAFGQFRERFEAYQEAADEIEARWHKFLAVHSSNKEMGDKDNFNFSKEYSSALEDVWNVFVASRKYSGGKDSGAEMMKKSIQDTIELLEKEAELRERFDALNKTQVDSDQDGMPDDYESSHSCLDTNKKDHDADSDGDGTNNLDEYKNHSDPCN